MIQRTHELLDGRHYTEYVERVRILKRAKRRDDALALLLRILDVIEASPAFPPPWWYDQAALLYTQQRRIPEAIAVCERYERAVRQSGVGSAGRVSERLAKLRARA